MRLIADVYWQYFIKIRITPERVSFDKIDAMLQLIAIALSLILFEGEHLNKDCTFPAQSARGRKMGADFRAPS